MLYIVTEYCQVCITILNIRIRNTIILCFIKNGTLNDKLDEDHDDNKLIKWLLQMSSALDYIHNTKHIIHRDIKST